METEIITKSPSSSTKTNFANLDKKDLYRTRNTEHQGKYREREKREKSKAVVPSQVFRTHAERQQQYQQEYRDRMKKQKQAQKLLKTIAESQEGYRRRRERTNEQLLRIAERQRVYRERRKLKEIEAANTVITSETNVSIKGSVEFTISEESGGNTFAERKQEKNSKTNVSLNGSDEFTISEESGGNTFAERKQEKKTRGELAKKYPDPVELAEQRRLKYTKRQREWQRSYRELQKQTRVKKRKTRAELEKEFSDPMEYAKHLRRKQREYQREYRERQKLRENQTPKSRKANVSFTSSDEFTISGESESCSYPIEYPESAFLIDIKEELIDPIIDEQNAQITVHPVNIKQEFEPPDIQETLTIKTEFVIPEIEDIKPIVSIKAELFTPKTEEVMIDDTYHPEFEPMSLKNGCDFVPKIREDKGCQFSTRWGEGFFETIFICNRFISDESSHAETQMDTVNIKTPISYSNSKK